MGIKHEHCSRPRCGAKMQRLTKRVHGKFSPYALDVPGLWTDTEGLKKG